jgi:hypothetical protein
MAVLYLPIRYITGRSCLHEVKKEDSMEQRTSWEANSRSATLLYSDTGPYPQMNSVHNSSYYFFYVRFNINLSSTSTSSKWSLSFRFSDQNFLHIPKLSHVRYMPSPSHTSFKDYKLILKFRRVKLVHALSIFVSLCAEYRLAISKAMQHIVYRINRSEGQRYHNRRTDFVNSR